MRSPDTLQLSVKAGTLPGEPDKSQAFLKKHLSEEEYSLGAVQQEYSLGAVKQRERMASPRYSPHVKNAIL